MNNEIIWSCLRFDELSTEDLYQILQLRAEIFVVEQDCAYQDVDDFDQGGLHVMGQLSGDDEAQLVSYSRLLPPGAKYEGASIGRVITKKSTRGGGVGKTLSIEFASVLQEALAWQGYYDFSAAVSANVLY